MTLRSLWLNRRGGTHSHKKGNTEKNMPMNKGKLCPLYRGSYKYTGEAEVGQGGLPGEGVQAFPFLLDSGIGRRWMRTVG